MKAYIVQSTRRIGPFGDHVGDCPIGNRKLATIQTETLKELRIEPVLAGQTWKVDDPDEHIVLGDNLYFSGALMEAFVSASRKCGSATTCSLKPGLTTLRTIVATQEVKEHGDRIEYCLHYYPPRQSRGERRPIVIDPNPTDIGLQMPRQICGDGKYSVPLTDKFVIQIDHWANLWAANISCLLQDGARLEAMGGIRAAWLALKARSVNKWKILRGLNEIGRNCDIHPAAYIEGSKIADNVTIGAGAVVRGSVIGAGTFIDNGVIVEDSILGENNGILDGRIMYSVLYDDVSSSTHRVITSLIGKSVLIGADVTLTNFRLDGKNVTVMRDRVKIDTQNTFLGCCVGHGSYIGAGCIIAPGRAIPSGMRITPEETRVIRSCDSDQAIPGFRQVRD